MNATFVEACLTFQSFKLNNKCAHHESFIFSLLKIIYITFKVEYTTQK